MVKREVFIDSYFSLPTDLAAEMKLYRFNGVPVDWPREAEEKSDQNGPLFER